MERQTVTIADTRKMTGLGTTKIYELIADGMLSTSKIGRRRLVHVDSIRTLLDSNRVAA